MDNWNPIAGIVPALTEETLKNLKKKRADAFYRRDGNRLSVTNYTNSFFT